MAKYIYDGPVTQFGKCIANKWHGETIAESQRKAISNLEYQFKKKNNMLATAKIGLPGYLEVYYE